jgi:hypothetical protein
VTPAPHNGNTATGTTLTMTTTQPPPVVIVTNSGSVGGWAALLFSGAVLAAIVGAAINMLLARRSTRLEERARVATTLAEAYKAYADYREFAYAVRRRRTDRAAEERVRLSEALREVQSRLSYHQAWTVAQSPAAGAAYNDLIREARRVAGGAIRDAWKAPALDSDAGMNIGSDVVNLSALELAEQRFLSAANEHVAALTRSWPRRALNRLSRPRHPAVPVVPAQPEVGPSAPAAKTG